MQHNCTYMHVERATLNSARQSSSDVLKPTQRL